MKDDRTDDADLLRQYASGSEPAFREIVQRHLGMVRATARRVLTSAPHLADDVTQAVFTDLAKQAPSLRAGVVLGGWLHRHACYLAQNAARAESRRRTRERTAMEINATNDNSGQDAQWAQLAPLLDDAISHLDGEDRAAIVLRFLEQRNLRSIGRALGTSEDAAQKRVARALEKLRGYLTRREITLSSILLASTLDAGAQTAVPPGMSSRVSATALHAATMAAPFTLTSVLHKMITSKVGLLASIIASVGLITALVVHNNSVVAVSPASAPEPSVVATTPAASRQVAAPAIPAQVTNAVGSQASLSSSGIMTTNSLPNGEPTESHSSVVRVSNGVVTTTTNDNGVVQTQTQNLPASGVVSGGNGNMSFMASNGTLSAGAFPMPTGTPTSTIVNANGSTTSTYAGPNGATTEITVSADGQSRSMKSVLGTPPSAN